MGLTLRTLRFAAVTGWLVMAAACATSGPLSRLTREVSPYEQYVNSLRDAGLDATALGRDWVAAGDRALVHAMPATTPLSETGYFEPGAPSAAAWRVDVARGRRLVVDVRLDAAAPTRLFVDLFAPTADGTHERLASLPAGATALTYEPEHDGTFVVRVQPELLRGGRYTVTQRTLAAVAFPVQGVTARAIQSLFGAERDAGRRTHEGIDIFAPRGTPVLAVADGLARPDTNALGGTVVWLHQVDAGRTFYYAHLDRWAFDESRQVVTGDVLGYIGNTGNARTTAPHLHFGIYSGGAIDPAPFLREDDPRPTPPASLALLGARGRVASAATGLRAGADRSRPLVRTLPRGTLTRVEGAQGRAYRVHLPNGQVGYVDQAALTGTTAPLARQRVEPGTALREAPSSDAPVVVVVEQRRELDILARFDAFAWVRDEGGVTGWLDASAATMPARR